MADNGNGTYSYSLSNVLIDGLITYAVILYKSGGVYSEWFDNTSMTGTPSVYNTSTTLNYNWGTSSITPSRSDSVSARYYAKVKAPTSETFTIYHYHDDGSRVYWDNVLKINQWTGGSVEHSFTANLVANQYYDLRIEWYEGGSAARSQLYWSSGSISKRVIPTANLYYPDYVSNSPNTVSVTCPHGYTGADPSSPTQ
jgi:hypothetical protein